MVRELRMGELTFDRGGHGKFYRLSQMIVRRAAELHVHRAARSTSASSLGKWASIFPD